jgi:hypothetical protein
MTIKTYKTLTSDKYDDVEREVLMMLHASRDCLRNQGHDTTKLRFDARDGYYGEAFGIMRGLQVLGYGEFAADNVPNSIFAPWNLKWWFRTLEDLCLDAEGYGGNNQCEHCLERYGKDAMRVRRKGEIVVPITPTIVAQAE